MKIIISAMPKVGSTVIYHIFAELYNAIGIHAQIDEFLLPIVKQFESDLKRPGIIDRGGIDQIKNNGIYIYYRIKHLQDGSTIYIKDIFLNNFHLRRLLNNSKSIFRTHELPCNILSNDFFSSFTKIYVVRNIFDLIHSHMKFIDQSKKTFEIMDLYKSQDKLTFEKYKNYNQFFNILQHWKNHVKSFLRNKSFFKLIKFEDFIINPLKTLISILEKESFNPKKIEDIINKKLNRELTVAKSHKYYRHYNPGPKIGNFTRFFTPSMIEIVKREASQLLYELGYN